MSMDGDDDLVTNFTTEEDPDLDRLALEDMFPRWKCIKPTMNIGGERICGYVELQDGHKLFCNFYAGEFEAK